MGFEVPSGTRGGRRPGRLFVLANALLAPVIRRRARWGSANLLILQTTGARSGQTRRSPLHFVDADDGSRLVIASAGGSQNNPAWFHNLAAHPDDVSIEIEGRTIPVRAEQLVGAERERVWASITSRFRQFGTYQEKTDRQIPVVRLVERPSVGS